MPEDERADWERRARAHAEQFDRAVVLDKILDQVALVGCPEDLFSEATGAATGAA